MSETEFVYTFVTIALLVMIGLLYRKAYSAEYKIERMEHHINCLKNCIDNELQKLREIERVRRKAEMTRRMMQNKENEQDD